MTAKSGLLLSALYTSIFATSSAPYISGDTFKAICDITFKNHAAIDYAILPSPCKVFCVPEDLETFFLEAHPHLPPYVLITHNSDLSVPHNYLSFLEDPKLIAWFGQNPDCQHQKFITIPIGIPNRSVENGNIECIKKMQNRTLNKSEDYLVYVNFNVSTNHQKRYEALQALKKQPYCYFPERVNHQQYLLDIKRSKFVASPEGTGLDCFRTWEALLLGSIPIVLSSPLDQLLEQLPVLIINNWNQLSEEFLLKKYTELSQKQYNTDLIYFNYWKEYINTYLK